MRGWVVIVRSELGRAAKCCRVKKNPSPQLLYFPHLQTCDARNPFRIRSYAKCRVTSFKPNIFLFPSVPVRTVAFFFLSSKFRIFFQVPYPLCPLLATLTKTAGMYTTNSHSGTPNLQIEAPLLFRSGAADRGRTR